MAVLNVLDAYKYKGSFHLWTELVPGIPMEELSPFRSSNGDGGN